jgi:hypothetical protein
MAASLTQKFESTRDFRCHFCFSFSLNALNRGLYPNPNCIGTRAPNQLYGLACDSQQTPASCALDTNEIYIPTIRA